MIGGGRRLVRRDNGTIGSWLFWAFLALAAAVMAVHLVLPWNSAPQASVYQGLNLASGLVLFGAVLLHRPERRVHWLLLSLALILWGVGDGVFNLYDWVLHEVRAYPSVADWIYLLGYAAMVVGIFLLVRSRQRRSGVSELLDGAIIASGTALVVWFAAIEPVALDHTTSPLSRAVSIAYPMVDVLLLALIVQLYFRSGARTYAFRALMLGALVLLGVDVAYSVQSLAGTDVSGGIIDLGWLLCGALWASAGLHPSMKELHRHAPFPSTGLTWQRLVLLGSASLAAPTMLLLYHAGPFDVIVAASASGLVTVLVFARMALLFRQHGRAETSLREAQTRSEVAVALHASNVRFQVATRAISCAIYEWRADVDTILWNDGLTETFGYAPPAFETANSWWLDQVHPEDRERVARQDADACQRDGDGSAEYRLLSADGSYRPVSDKWVCFMGSDGVRRMIGGIVDISDQRSLEEQLRQSQRLEVVGRLAGGVAHDFNNLLTAIGGYAELLALRVQPDSGLAEPIAQISRAADRAAALTGQLLAFSRRQVLQPRVVDMNEVVTGVSSILGRLLGEDITVELHLANTIRRVMADPAQLEQVLVNLAVNARDAMPAGGSLRISTRDTLVDLKDAEKLELAGAGHYVELAVADVGSGMDAETQQRAFEPFFTTKELGKGTGLGLSTVYGIVRQSGGSVAVESEPGGGTTFRVLLPVTESVREDAWQPVVGAQPAHGAGARILLVEDEDLVRSVVSDMLELAGHEVTAIGSPTQAALTYPGEVPFDLLVTDIVMPGMSGTELAATLTARSPSLKVLLISGFAGDYAHQTDQPVLDKPFDSSALATRIAQLLGRELAAAV